MKITICKLQEAQQKLCKFLGYNEGASCHKAGFTGLLNSLDGGRTILIQESQIFK